MAGCSVTGQHTCVYCTTASDSVVKQDTEWQATVLVILTAAGLSLEKNLSCHICLDILFACFFLSYQLQHLTATKRPPYYFRQEAGAGVSCCLLVPLCFLFTVVGGAQEPQNSSVTSLQDDIVLLSYGLIIVGLLCMFCHSISYTDFQSLHNRFNLFIGVSFMTCCRYVWLVAGHQRWYSSLCIVLLLSGAIALCIVLPKCLPESFTPGESVIVVHGLIYFLVYSTTLYTNEIIHDRDLTKDMALFVQTAIISSLVVSCTMYILPVYQRLAGYYALVLSVMVCFSLPVLLTYFDEDFVTWMIHHILKRKLRVCLFIYWSICSAMAVLIVYCTARNFLPQTKPVAKPATEPKVETLTSAHCCSECRCETHTNGKSTGRSLTVVRKQFHILALLIYLPGLVYDRELLFAATSCALVVMIMLEGIRINDIPPLGNSLRYYLQVFVDDRDKGPVILTHLYLIAGLSLPVWILSPHQAATVSLYSGFLTLGVGDTAASIIGSRYGKHHWPGSRKTLEGTAAAIISQLIVVLILNLSNVVQVQLIRITMAVTLCSLLEAFTTQIDNLVLPLFMFMLCS